MAFSDELAQAAFDSRVLATYCFFATDVHSHSLGKGAKDDTLVKISQGDANGCEVAMVFGKQVGEAGRPTVRSFD